MSTGQAFTDSDAEPIPLPTYAFQRERYWLAASNAGADMTSAGQTAIDHPLLSAALALADGKGWLFTGRLTLDAQSWIGDRAVLGAAPLPSSAFLELALRVGGEVGCEEVAELVLAAPLVLSERGAVQIQVSVGEPDEAGRRTLAIHTRPEHTAEDLPGGQAEWVCHATGILVSSESSTSDERAESLAAMAWPPHGTERVPLDAERVPLDGHLHASQGAPSVWRHDAAVDPGYAGGETAQPHEREELFVEVALPPDQQTDAGRYVLHPGLLDAAMHAALSASHGGHEAGVRFVSSWCGVRAHAEGPSSLRIRISPTEGEVGVSSMVAVDEDGAPVASARSLSVGTRSSQELADADRGQRQPLFGLEWVKAEASSAQLPPSDGWWAVLGDANQGLADGLVASGFDARRYADLDSLAAFIADGSAPAPEIVLVDCAREEGEGDNRGAMAEVARTRATRILALVQSWLADERFSALRLALLTRGAVAIDAREGLPDLASAPVWGLVRSAQAENPGRLVLLDVEGPESSLSSLHIALACEEPQLAVRESGVLVPRLVSLLAPPPDQNSSRDSAFDEEPSRDSAFGPRGTVLITGGTGGLGGLLARHLVSERGVRGLLLASRRGDAAEGALELKEELESFGAQVRIATCDVTDRREVEALLGSVDEDRPLSAVVHVAGVLDDGVIASLTAERMDRVLAPKVDAAWHLHELTEHMGLSAFVLFSSAAGTFGAAGQGNYAAANAFLDALAAYRHALGLPGVSLAWGLWDTVERSTVAGMTHEMSAVDRARVARLGVTPLSIQEGLSLFDLATALAHAQTIPVRLDSAVLRAQARAGTVPALLRRLIRVPQRRALERAGGSLARRLADLSERERRPVVRELVRAEVAAVLGHASAQAIDPGRAFKELGFDSLIAVELRNRLSALAGLQLPATLVFDYPSTVAVADYLLDQLVGMRRDVSAAVAAHASDEPIAIVGMSCRYPGGVRSPEEMWELVSAGSDAISGFPSDRGWDLENLFDPDPDSSGSSYVRDGGFVEGAGEFDAGFFGISPREALAMDPQQRLLLEAVWEAFEDAGIPPDTLRGSRTGIFAGPGSQDYGALLRGSVPSDLEGYLGTGSAASVLSGRVAYTFGLEGPAVTVDTACSSSLVALHLACQSLRSGECSMALAGGVTVLSTPGVFVVFSRQRGLALDGRCKSFADGADGTGWGEGVGVVLLERLSDARRLGHEVLAVVRGSAVNQDGASNGLSAPNGPSQQRVIAQALANAGVGAGEVDVVEAHGTGTSLGDPIEAQALLATYGQGREEGRPLWLGSVKSNIGHTQAAAGVAGVIKMVMAMRHGVLPRTLHVGEPSRQVDWSAGAVSLLTEEVPWQVNGRPRRAGVSSFGLSGTNAHVILEDAPAPAEIPEGDEPQGVESASGIGVDGVVPWVVSGRSEGALRGQAGRLLEFVNGDRELEAPDVGLSLATMRVGFERRAVVVGGSREGLLGGLSELARGEGGVGVIEGAVDDGVSGVGGGPVFVFPGQGSQWVGMAAELLDSSPPFAEQIRLCGAALAPLVEWSLEDVLRGEGDAVALDRVDVVQPALFAVMVSLARLWQACGVRPGVVMGHSQGEIAAAFVAGGLSLEDAARLVVLRSRALVGLIGRGGMVSVALSVGELEGWLERCEGVSVAAVNGPGSVVVSGERQALDGLLSELVRAGVRAREIPVGYASHSSMIEEIRGELLDACAGLVPRSGSLPFFSTLAGKVVDTAELDGEYWYRNLRETVGFEGAIRSLLAEGHRAFIEVSPHPVLTVGVQEAADEALDPAEGVLVAGSLRREQGGLERFLTSLGEVWVRGVDVDWARVFEGSGARRVGLPTYAFQRERYWLQGAARGAGDVTSAGLDSADHPLLSAAMAMAGGEGWLFTGRLSLETHPWLADHAVMGAVLLPGAAFVELALRAGSEVGCAQIAELTLETPLVLPDEGGVQMQISLGEPDEDGGRSVGIYSRAESAPAKSAPSEGIEGEGQQWICHAGGVLRPGAQDAGEPPALPEEATAFLEGAWPPPGADPVVIDDLYGRVAELGCVYGPVFQGLSAVWRDGDEVFAEVALPEEEISQASRFGVHPALLDAALQAAGPGLLDDAEAGEDEKERTQMRLPFSWAGVGLHAVGASRLRVRLSRKDTETVSLVAGDENGALVVSVDSLVSRPISTEQLDGLRGSRQESLYRVSWIPVSSSLVPARARVGRWAVLGAESTKLAGALGAVAAADVIVHAGLASLCVAIDEGAAVPDAVYVDCTAEADAEGDLADVAGGVAQRDLADVAGGVARRLLALLQAWLGDERFAECPLVLVSSGAVAVSSREELPGLSAAPAWGLVRSAQSEEPGRFVLVDVDGQEESWGALPCVLESEEPQLAIRGGELLAARLARVTPAMRMTPTAIDPHGTVLITGGTGGLGSVLARHLVSAHGARHLLLVNRSGREAPGAQDLEAELTAMGSQVTISACDVADRDELQALIESVSSEHPLRTVVHTAGVFDDGLVRSLTSEQFDRVQAPKVNAAWHLHELTKDLPVSTFVLFSSSAGVFGGSGQGNYAAANTFLDALAAYRRGAGLPGISMAWGVWATEESGMASYLDEVDLARLTRLGRLSQVEGLELFDSALGVDEALVLPMRLDSRMLSTVFGTDAIPPLLRGLVRARPRGARGESGSLARTLMGVPEAERERVAIELVRAQAAIVLGHASSQAIEAQRAFTDLGFDSLTAVELRNRLGVASGLRLPATIVFDYPNPTALAHHLLSEVAREKVAPASSVNAELDKLERTLLESPAEDGERTRVAERLQALLSHLRDSPPPDGAVTVATAIETATADEVFDFIDRELGS
jgi:acyl transferase domain-containing protein/acyl carrier protein